MIDRPEENLLYTLIFILKSHHPIILILIPSLYNAFISSYHQTRVRLPFLAVARSISWECYQAKNDRASKANVSPCERAAYISTTLVTPFKET